MLFYTRVKCKSVYICILFLYKRQKYLARVIVIICIFIVKCKRHRIPVRRFFAKPSFSSHRISHILFSSSFFLSPDASIEILLACSFEWFEVLKRRSITRHFRNPEESDAIAEEDGNDDSDESAERTFRVGNGRPNSSTRIVQRVLMDYSLGRKLVDQREFIAAFAIDVCSCLNKRLDVLISR